LLVRSTIQRTSYFDNKKATDIRKPGDCKATDIRKPANVQAKLAINQVCNTKHMASNSPAWAVRGHGESTEY